MINLVLIAPPAAGKGTLSSILSKQYNIPHISTGDLLRDRVNVNDSFGIKLHEMMQMGCLIDDDIVLSLLKSRICMDDCHNGFILDGYPRNIEQAVQLSNLLEELNYSLTKVIYLTIDEETSYKRIAGRMTCPKCNSIYNKFIDSKKPKNDSICDRCGSALTIRVDDNEDSFIERFNTFNKLTLPVIEFYKNSNIIVTIDGKQDSQVIAESIYEILRGKE